ncbi:MAG: class I SAM-dependent methyltransferase [Opitutales bacterium]
MTGGPDSGDPAASSSDAPLGPVTGNFQRRAGSYDAHTPVQAAFAAWLAEWLPERETDAPCLELGAGTGHLTQFLLQRFRHVTASDAAPAMVAAGRHRLPRANWQILDAWHPNLDAAGAGWSWLAASSLLQLTPEPELTLLRWRELMGPDARFLAGWFVPPTLAEIRELNPVSDLLQWRQTEDWLQLLTATGWKVRRHEQRTLVRAYPSALAFFRSLHRSGATAPAARLDAGKMKRLLGDYEQRFGSADGVRATWSFLRVEAAA